MSESEKTIIIVVVVLFLVTAPGIPIVLAWFQGVKHHALRHWDRRVLLALLLQTISFVWLLAGLWHGPIIGPDYSTRRSVVIAMNLAVAIVCCVVSALANGPQRSIVVWAAGAIALDWVYVAVVSVAV